MKTNPALAALLCVLIHSSVAGNRTFVTKSDAEAILGVPVKDPKARNEEGSDEFYD